MTRRLLFGLAPPVLALPLAACAEPEGPAAASSAALESTLWGVSGEAFDPTGRLMDWSYAGYGASERPIPDVPVVTNVLDHGAVADDATDDGAAFEAAITATRTAGGGAVLVPPGRFVLRRRLQLPSRVVLRGAGRDRTTLFFPEHLEALYGTGTDWSFSGGFLASNGSWSHVMRATVSAAAARGDDELTLSSVSGLSVGSWIVIRQTDVNGTLIRRLHADLVDGGTDNIGDVAMRLPARVLAINGNTIRIDRALTVDVEPRWSPAVYSVRPDREEVGVEHLTVEFPHTMYPGHFNEHGYNAVYFTGVWNGWVRSLRIINSDFGVSLVGSFFVTVSDVVLEESASRGSLTGHHGLNNGHGGDNLFIDFDVRARFVHDLTNEWYAHGVVFTRGRGVDLCMDHHRAAGYQTLWTEIDTGAGTRPWASGGSSNRGPHTAAYDTSWNIRGARALALPPADYGPRMNLVGFGTGATSAPAGSLDWHFERIAPADLSPPNLWEAMVARRLGGGGPDAGAPDLGVRDAGSAAPDAGAAAPDADGATADMGRADALETPDATADRADALTTEDDARAQPDAQDDGDLAGARADGSASPATALDGTGAVSGGCSCASSTRDGSASAEAVLLAMLIGLVFVRRGRRPSDE